ncbi:MAG: hypothetical protein PHR14_10840, partial [Oscillospiraceae bacterium]|nr:hypothetical protein [Oscillospiraceae bacterium]
MLNSITAGILKVCPAVTFTGTSRVWYPDVVFVTNLMVQSPGCRQIKAKYPLSVPSMAPAIFSAMVSCFPCGNSPQTVHRMMELLTLLGHEVKHKKLTFV